MILKIKTKNRLFRKIVSHKIDFMACGPHRDHPLACEVNFEKKTFFA